VAIRVAEGAKPNVFSNTTSLSAFHIEISASGLKFSIRDNCGGITLDNAAKYAFTFGRDDEMEHDAYSIGVYGIGMKRAIFKLGSVIQIRSTYSVSSRGKSKDESFRVPINVTKWLAAKAWDFDLEADETLPEPGLEISVSKLSESTSRAFGRPLGYRAFRIALGFIRPFGTVSE
jgi:hypothetical protein